MIIAIDGPAGAGKSTVCRLLAKELGYTYLDTGAMYRAVAWSLLHNVGNDKDEARLAGVLPQLPLRFMIEENTLSICYQNRKLEDELRSLEITRQASRISQIPAVREFLTQWQRRLAESGKIVVEGRDMTTVVFPDAPVKVFLTADLATRTKRRQADYLSKGISVDRDNLEAQIRDRDKADAERSVAPLRPAKDALILDTSKMEIPEVVNSLRQSIYRITGEKTLTGK